jgi:hypothetical protein
MPTSFWIKRFFTVFRSAFVIIGAVQLLKGRSLEYSVTEAAIWAGIAAAIFIVARYFQARKNIPCALCKDTPESNDGKKDAGV